MNWINNIPIWKNTGEKPPDPKIDEGFRRERLPYAWLNWILNALTVNLKENRDGIDRLEQETDAKIAAVTASGIPKLNMYEYSAEATNNQTVFNFQMAGFDMVTDTIRVYVNTAKDNKTRYTASAVTDGFRITFAHGLEAGSLVEVEVWKHVPMGEEGMISGTVISTGSMPMNRISGLEEALAIINGRLDNLE